MCQLQHNVQACLWVSLLMNQLASLESNPRSRKQLDFEPHLELRANNGLRFDVARCGAGSKHIFFNLI